MDVNENLNAIGTAADASEATIASIEEAKTRIEAAQAAISAAIADAREAVTAVTGAVEAAHQATQGAQQATTDHLEETQRLQHQGAAGHLEQARDHIDGSLGGHSQTGDGINTTLASLTELDKSTAEAMAATGASLSDRTAEATAAREGLEEARRYVTAAGEA